VLEGEDEAGHGDLGPSGRADGIAGPRQGRFVLTEPARVRPHREIADEAEPRANHLVVLDVGDRQVAQRLGGIEQRGQIDVAAGQVPLDRGDGELPRRGLVRAAHQGGGPDASGVVEDQRLGDPTPERMAGHPHGVTPTQVVEHGQGVDGHPLHAVRRVGRPGRGQAAVVEGRHLIAGRHQRGHQAEMPGGGRLATPGDEEHGVALAPHLVVEGDLADAHLRHGAPRRAGPAPRCAR